MIFDAHLHLSETSPEALGLPPFAGGLAISRSVDQNNLYVRATRELGLKCAVFVGPSECDVEQVIQWITDGTASAYDHVELLEHFEPQKIRSICEASAQVGRPLVLHVSHHNSRRTSPDMVSSCLDYLAENFPDLKVVVSHLAGENFDLVLRFAESNPNLFFEISKLAETAERVDRSSPTDLLKNLGNTVPATRIVFGTDQVGVWNPASSMEYAAVREVFSQRDSEQILSENALALFG